MGIYDENIEREIKQYKFFNSMDKLIDCSDIIIVATSTVTHHQIVKKCLSMKKNILVEKPYSLNKKELYEINDLVKKNKTFIKIGLLEKYNPAVQFLLNEDLDSEEINSVYIQRLSPSDQVNRNKDHVLLDLSIHDFDILNRLFKEEFNDIDFQFFYKNGNEYDHVDIIGKSKNINVVISTSKLSQKKTRTIVIYTKKLMYSLNLINNSVEIISHEGLESLNTKVVGGFKEKLNTTFPIIDHSEPLVEQMKHFLFTIEKNELEENYEEFSEDLKLHEYLISKI
tara:strand:- start:1093 stop:1941 length:849 start_codon:yes stop_codon:yes gene_type:complete